VTGTEREQGAAMKRRVGGIILGASVKAAGTR